MSIDIEKLERFIHIIKDNISKLTEIRSKGKQEFLNDYRNYHTALRLLQISIEAMIDMGNHIVARKSMGNPKDYVEIFHILKINNILNEQDYLLFAKMVKFRNRIVHIYWETDLNEVYSILENNLNDFHLFIERINAYIEISMSS